MPLVAIVNDENVEAWAQTAEEWTALKGTYRSSGLTMTCGQEGFPKTSPRGRPFFSHKAGANCQLHEGGPETAEHLAAKAAIAEAARACGWIATVEYPAPDRSWIADVLVERDGRRIAIEVQWSPQTEADFLRRQGRYEAAGLECFWLSGPSNARTAHRVPSHALAGTAENLTIALHTSITGSLAPIDLRAGIIHLLRGDFQDQAEAIAAGLEVETLMVRCWQPSCTRWMTVWYLSAVDIETRCGQRGRLTVNWSQYERWATERVETVVQDAVVSTVRQTGLAPAARYGRRFAKELQQHYQAALCPTCGIHQGDAYMPRQREWTTYQVPYRATFPFLAATTNVHHLCIDGGRGRCEPRPALESPTFPRSTDSWSVQPPTAHKEALELPTRLPTKFPRSVR